MGLDVYLYRYDNFEATKQAETEAAEFLAKAWDVGVPYDAMTETQKEAARAACKEFYEAKGLDEWGSDEKGKRRIEIDYPSSPDHLFKIGYFRSSYNDSGIDRLMRMAIGETLGSLFDVSDDYVVQPNWAASLARTKSALERWKAVVAEHGAWSVSRINSPLLFDDRKEGITSADQAMAKFLEVRSRSIGNASAMLSFSSSDGDFYLAEKPPVFRGFLYGQASLLGRSAPCIYAVSEFTGIEWYWTALEIVAETCRYVLNAPDPERYYLHWSA